MTAPSQRRVGAATLRTARNAAVSAGSDVIGKFATLAWTVLAARLLGQDDFGAFFYSLTLALLLSAVATWGFAPVMVQRATRDLTALPELFSRSVAWQLGVGLPLFAAAGAVASLFRPSDSARIVLVLVFAAVLLDRWSETCRAASAAAQEQGRTATALVVQRAATALLVVVALVAGGGVVGMAAAFLLGSVVGVIAHSRALRHLDVRFSRRALTAPLMREFASETWLLGLTAVALMALFRVDAVLLGALDGDEAVAAYAAAYKLLETVLFVTFALKAAVFPVMSASDDPGVTRRGTETVLGALAVLYLPFAVVCLVEPTAVLDLLYGEPYTEQSRDILRFLAPAPLLYGLAYILNGALQARRAYGSMLAAALLASALNLVLNLLLIPPYGGPGAALATSLSYAFVGGYSVLALRRRGVRPRVLRPLAEPALACAVLALVLAASRLPLLVELPLGAIVFLLVYAAAARRWSPENLAVVRGLVRRAGG